MCCLQLKPQELPTSTVLLSVTLLGYVIISTALSLPRLSLGDALLSSVLEVCLLITLVASLLYFTHHSGRITQTLTALGGTNMLLGIVSSPILLWFYQAKLYQWDIGIPAILLFNFTLWNLAVYAYILHHALETTFFTGLIVSLIIFSVIVSILNQVFPLTG